jgi:hypothetical protein
MPPYRTAKQCCRQLKECCRHLRFAKVLAECVQTIKHNDSTMDKPLQVSVPVQ